MRRIALFLLFSIFCIAPAMAEVSRPMSSHPSAGELAATCDAVGGTFVDNPAIEGVGPAHYGCRKANCDGKGGECRVDCGPTGCTGTTPSILSGPKTLVGILQDGNNVLHEPKDDGPRSLVDGGPGSNAIAPAPVKDPVPVLL